LGWRAAVSILSGDPELGKYASEEEEEGDVAELRYIDDGVGRMAFDASLLKGFVEAPADGAPRIVGGWYFLPPEAVKILKGCAWDLAAGLAFREALAA